MRDSAKWVGDRQSVDRDFIDVADRNATLQRWHQVSEGANVHMFVEDVTGSVVPYGRRNEPDVSLEPYNATAEQLVIAALGSTSWRRPSLEEVVIDFVRACTVDLMHFGVAQYEVVNYRPTGESVAAFFTLERVMPHTLRRQFYWFGPYQQHVGEQHGDGRPRRIRVDADRIVTLTLPEDLSAHRLYKIKRALTELGTTFLVEMVRRVSARPKSFDFSIADRRETLLEATLTAQLGWNHRGGLEKHITQYYYLVRELRFRIFVASLREHILRELNDVLATTLPLFGHRGRLVISGLTGRVDLERFMSRLEKGAHPRDIAREFARIS